MYEEGTVGFETTISFGNDFVAPPSFLSSGSSTMGFSATGIAPTPALTSGASSDSEPESEGEAHSHDQRPQQVKTSRKSLRM